MFVLFTGAAFAQNLPNGVSASFWGRAAFVPFELQVNKDEPDDLLLKHKITTAIGPSWGLQPSGRAANLCFRGNSQYVGFVVEIEADVAIRLGEYSYIWAKPFGEYVRLDVGVFMNDELRGVFGGDSFDYFVLRIPVDMEDSIFNRFAVVSTQNEAGALLGIYPIQGLTLAAFMKVRNSKIEKAALEQLGPLMKTSLDRMQFAAGYRIPGAGHLRLQFLNAPNFTWAGIPTGEGIYNAKFQGDELNYYYNQFKRIEAAFNLTALSGLGLGLDIGVKIPFPYSNQGIDYSAPIMASMGANYTIDDFGIGLNLQSWFGGKVKGQGQDRAFAQRAAMHLIPTYNLGFAIVGGLIGLDLKGNDKNDGIKMDNKRLDIGLGAYIRKNYSNGNICAGFTYTFADLTNDKSGFRTLGYFRIPIIMEIAFF